MKLLKDGVLVKIPKFSVATSEGEFEVDFSILFKRTGHKERRKRDKDLRDNMKLMSKLQEIMDADADKRDDKALFTIQDKIAKSEDQYDQYLFDDVIGWEGLKDMDDTDVPYNEDNKAAVMDSDPFRKAILSVWRASSGGVTKQALEEADAKN